MFLNRIKKLKGKDRIVISNILGAFFIKGLSLLVSLFTMPAYMNYFHNQQILGVWFTVLSIVTWILNFDLGIGNGLRNKLTFALAKGDKKEAKVLISSSYFSVGVIVIFISFFGSICLSFVNWNLFFNISEKLISNDILLNVVVFSFIGILIQFFLRLISSILYALQLSSANNFLLLITSLMQLCFALIAPIKSPEENIVMFSKAYIVCSNLPLLIASLCVFCGPMKECVPNLKFVDKSRIKSILSLGGLFFLCQILYMIIANTNEFFISKFTGPNNVVDYQIYNKLFTLGSTLFMLALTPLWSAISKSIAENDYQWLDKTYKRMIKLSFLVILVEFILIFFLQFIVDIWLGINSIPINYIYALIFALYGSVMVIQSTVSTVGNGLGKLDVQAISYSLGIGFKLLFIYFIYSFSQEWIYVILANVIILTPYCFVQHKKIKKEIEFGLKK